MLGIISLPTAALFAYLQRHIEGEQYEEKIVCDHQRLHLQWSPFPHHPGTVVDSEQVASH